MRWRLVALVVVLGLAGCTAGRPGPERAPPTRPPPPADGEPVWRTLAPAPSERTEVAAAAVGQRIWVLGGYAPDGATLATVEVYDTTTDTWARGPDLPVAVNHAMAATLDGVLHVAGGNDGDGPSTQVARLEGDGWRRLAPLPQGRSAGGLVALDGRLYLVGGVVDGGLAADTQVYDPAADRWSPAPGLPTPREHLGAAATGGKVYVVGGRVGGIGRNLGAAEAFDPATGRWAALAELPTPRGGLAATATAGGEVVAVGGEAAATFPEAEALDTASGRWRSLPPLPTPRHGLGVVAVGDTVYVLAGGPRPGLHTSAANEAIDLG
ncbi:MAG TPA: kelch repeat-containing protein [Actinomycetota bacterium]|jgi:Kelch motif/Galactose oxidase, central domain|nr:kelch repeat-containing protein [Actinomycetota bacterium]